MKQAQKLGFLLSFSFLIVSILEWSDLFLFSKTVYLPGWSDYLPDAINLPRYLTFMCLIPFLLTHSIYNYKKPLAIIVATSPLPALVFYILDHINNTNVYANTAFNYAWILIWNIMFPTILIIMCIHVKPIFKQLSIKKGRTRRPFPKH